MCSSNDYGNEGWKVYPENLRFAPIEVDPAGSNQLICQLSKELFVENQESTFEHANLGALQIGMNICS
jgi:hypothetical protein